MNQFQHEVIIPNDGFPFKMFLFEGAGGHYVREKHWHRSIEIFAVFDGELAVYVDEKEFPLTAGQFILLNSNEVHSIVASKPNETIVFQIPLKLFEPYYTDENFILFTHSPRNQDLRVMELIKDIYREYKGKGCGYELKVQSEFYMLMYLLVTRYRKTNVDPDVVRHHRKLSRLSDINAYIRDNYTKELSLESLARIFGYSPSYLSRMFQKYAKTNYKTYLQNLRVEYAYKELTGTDHTISEIALNHGFPNSKAFSREFRKKYGVLPSEFRKGQKNAIE